ncbi:MAG: hypothetical protein WCH39_12590, partial [Schlesneria sp.]
PNECNERGSPFLKTEATGISIDIAKMLAKANAMGRLDRVKPRERLLTATCSDKETASMQTSSNREKPTRIMAWI